MAAFKSNKFQWTRGIALIMQGLSSSILCTNKGQVCYLGLVCHDEGELCVHRRTSDEVSGLDRVTIDQVPLPVAYQSSKEHPQGLQGGGLGVIPVILQHIEYVLRGVEIHCPIERQK